MGHNNAIACSQQPSFKYIFFQKEIIFGEKDKTVDNLSPQTGFSGKLCIFNRRLYKRSSRQRDPWSTVFLCTMCHAECVEEAYWLRSHAECVKENCWLSPHADNSKLYGMIETWSYRHSSLAKYFFYITSHESWLFITLFASLTYHNNSLDLAILCKTVVACNSMKLYSLAYTLCTCLKDISYLPLVTRTLIKCLKVTQHAHCNPLSVNKN